MKKGIIAAVLLLIVLTLFQNFHQDKSLGELKPKYANAESEFIEYQDVIIRNKDLAS